MGLSNITSRLVIFSFIFSLLPNMLSYADTCDDVRQLYGKPPLDTQEYHSFIEYVDTIGELQSKRKSAEEMLEAQDRIDSLFNKYNELVEEKQELVDTISTLMQTDSNTMAIIGKTRELVSVNDKLQQMNLSTSTSNLVDIKDNYIELNKQIGNNRNYINDRYNIGHLKTGWPVETTASTTILKGYGTEGSETGVYLNARDARRIDSMFTGVVTKKEHSDTYGDWIEIQSGKGIQVTYSGLKNIKVKLGDRVEAGRKIADSCDNSEALYIEMILDGNYVNPLLVMGLEGVNANNAWIYENVGDSDMTQILSMNSYDYTPVTLLWDTN